ncbi:MAG TPA: hypothetical protein VGU45_13155 [Microvirga sp.]|jgi:hypothetical protein|nr:hypothetical protein [Microvirga sp.]
MAHASYGNNSDMDKSRPDQDPGAKPKAGGDRPGFDLGGAKDRDGTAGNGTPSSGPHAEESLTNPDATPGAGSLPPVGGEDGTDSTSS